MQLIFDLDDTLYDERTFVTGGVQAVARDLHSRYGVREDRVFNKMMNSLADHGRGAVFDRILQEHGVYSKREVKRLVKVYRYHKPSIQLFPEAKELLQLLRPHSTYLVTDGHKMVQAAKVMALGLDRLCKGVYITHRYGIRHAKPSTHCFELIRKREKCGWRDMAYVGDNPEKDFVNLNPLGVLTVRVLTGSHKEVRAKAGYDARVRIHSLRELAAIPGVLL